MHPIAIALFTAAFYGVYNFFIKVASGDIHQIVGAVVLQVVATLLGGGVLLYLLATGTTLPITGKGLQYAVLAGFFVGLAEIASFYAFSKGLSASVGIPLIVGGTVVVGVLLGALFLKEHLTILQYVGIVLMVVSVMLLTAK